MKVMTWKAILAVSLAAILTLSVGWSVKASPQRHDFELEGTWLVTVTQKNCSTGSDAGNVSFDPDVRRRGNDGRRYNESCVLTGTARVGSGLLALRWRADVLREEHRVH